MPRMMLVVPQTFFVPIIDVSDLTDQEASQFFDKCADWLNGNSDLFLDNMSIDKDGLLFTNTPLTTNQLKSFCESMGLENATN